MKPDDEDEEMLPEYDLTGGVRGKYVERYLESRKSAPAAALTLPRLLEEGF